MLSVYYMFSTKQKYQPKGVFRVKKSIGKKLKKRKKKIKNRTQRRNWEEQDRPMLSGSNIHYDFDGRNKGIAGGGIGIIHMLAQKTGLIKELDEQLEILKRHIPYHESDHIFNM
jgi:hypothetical protein